MSDDQFGPQLDQLEAQRTAKQSSEDEPEYVDATEIAIAALEKSAELHKNTALLLEYISDETFCKTITKRERDTIKKQLAKIEAMSDELDETIEIIQDEEDEEEDEAS